MCNEFANRFQKSLCARCLCAHSTILSIKTANHLQCHSFSVRAKCGSIICFRAFSYRMHWSTCCSKVCMSIPEGKGHSWPPSAIVTGKVYREHGTYHAFLYACTKIFRKLSNSPCDHLMRAAENQKAPIPFCAKSLAENSGVSLWL